MKKKRFYQHSYGLMFLTTIFLLIVIAGIYTVSVGIYKLISSGKSTKQILIGIFCLMVCLGGTAYSLYSFIIISKFRIVFDRDSIFIPNDWFGREYRAQYKTRVKYSDISKIELIRSGKNSLNKKISGAHYIAFANKPYLQLTLHNGRKKRFLLLYFKKDQWEEIIDELKHRLIATGNEITLPSTKDMIKAVEEDKAETTVDKLVNKAYKICQADSTGRLSDYFTYEEFCDLFVNKHLIWKIKYKDLEFVIEQTKKRSSFHTETPFADPGEPTAETQTFSDPGKHKAETHTCVDSGEHTAETQNCTSDDPGELLTETQSCTSDDPEKLLAGVTIEGQSLNAVWNDLYLCSLQDPSDGSLLYPKNPPPEK